jgi:hypothetical protein
MSSDDSAMANMTSTDIILKFGNYIKAMHQAETGPNSHVLGNLSSDEISIIYTRLLANDTNLARVFKQKLDLPLSFYYAVRHQVMSLLQVLDAMIEEKSCHDSLGFSAHHERKYQESFVLCAEMIPKRVKIGLLGAFRGLPGMNDYNEQPSPDTMPFDHETVDYYSEIYALTENGSTITLQGENDDLSDDFSDELPDLISDYSGDSDNPDDDISNLPDYISVDDFTPENSENGDIFEDVPSFDGGISQIVDVVAVSSEESDQDTYSPSLGEANEELPSLYYDGGQHHQTREMVPEDVLQASARLDRWDCRLKDWEARPKLTDQKSENIDSLPIRSTRSSHLMVPEETLASSKKRRFVDDGDMDSKRQRFKGQTGQ